MDFQIDPERLTGAKIFLGCPVYDGRCHYQFSFALCQLSTFCTQLGIPLQIFFAAGEALIMRARNAIADRFLQSDATHLMLIDADMGFNAIDVISMLDLQKRDEEENGYDVLSAPYPLKRISWDNVAEAVKLGLVGDDAASLQNFSTNVLLHPAYKGSYDISLPFEVTQAGTGFMMIRRKTLELFQETYPHRRYSSSNVGIERDCSPTITQFFDTAIDGGTDTLQEDLCIFLEEHPQAGHEDIRGFLSYRAGNRQDYVSEDFMFCRLVRRIGMKVWTCPWMTLSHSGLHEFRGRLADLARLGPV